MSSFWRALLWTWHHWDAALSHLLSHAHSSRPRASFWAGLGAHLGDSWLWLLMTGLLWRWWRTSAGRPARPLWGWAGSLIAGAAITVLLKRWVRRPRPREERLLHGPGADRYSFPSGHAVRWGIIAVWSSRFLRRGALLAWPLALWTGWSRVYLGVHYVGDVVAGYAAGALLGSLVRYFLGETERRGLPQSRKGQ